MGNNEKKAKLIHINKETDKAIKVAAAGKGTNAKNYIEELVEKHSKHLTTKTR